jgi:outer membrane protein OmpA-like peptidoglycan-associated protein
MRPVTQLVVFLCLLSFPAVAAAQGAWMSIEQDVLDPGQKVTFIMVPDDDLWRAEIHVTRDDGRKQSFTADRTAAGTRLTYQWKQEEGEHDYDVTVLLVYPDARKATLDDSYHVVVAGPLTGSIPASEVDLEAHTFVLRSSRAVEAVQIEILDENLDTVTKETVHIEPANQGTSTTIPWTPSDSDVPIFRIWVRAYDQWNFWVDNEIIPWSLTIPHEEVTFATNAFDITDEEAPKLDRAYKEISKAVDKYGDFVQCKLYIAGYTDTVGDPGSNQTLSNNRARSIARYFQTAGFEFPIYYQGFGENVLAVPTGDSVDELANRRALYVIAADTPPSSRDLPRSSWTRLQ